MMFLYQLLEVKRYPAIANYTSDSRTPTVIWKGLVSPTVVLTIEAKSWYISLIISKYALGIPLDHNAYQIH